MDNSEANHPEDKLKIYRYNPEINEYEYLTNGLADCTIGDIVKFRKPDTGENYFVDKWSDGTVMDAVRIDSEPKYDEDTRHMGCIIQPVEEPAT